MACWILRGIYFGWAHVDLNADWVDSGLQYFGLPGTCLWNTKFRSKDEHGYLLYLKKPDWQVGSGFLQCSLMSLWYSGLHCFKCPGTCLWTKKFRRKKYHGYLLSEGCTALDGRASVSEPNHSGAKKNTVISTLRNLTGILDLDQASLVFIDVVVAYRAALLWMSACSSLTGSEGCTSLGMAALLSGWLHGQLFSDPKNSEANKNMVISTLRNRIGVLYLASFSVHWFSCGILGFTALDGHLSISEWPSR